MLAHGGQLRNAAQKYNIPLKNWIDLSTGINPNAYPIPEIPISCWQRLPENDDGLLNAAQEYYQAEKLLAVAGSQAAIQALPLLYPRSRVGVLYPAYAEHEHCWQQAGHQIIRLTPKSVEKHLSSLQVLIIINPNNPTAALFPKEQLLDWQQGLQAQNGVLIVDEAFMDTCPEHSLASLSPRKGLIVLRSIGKFFGLAGIRCGFVIAEESLLQALEQKLGVWSLNHPGRYVAATALKDKDWQQHTLKQLNNQSLRLQSLLNSEGLHVSGSHALFQWVKTPDAKLWHQKLAKQGILTRLFTEPSSLRFGLPRDEEQWQKLISVLNEVKTCQRQV